MRRAQSDDGPIDRFPDAIGHLHALNILCQVVQAMKQIEGITKRGYCSMTQACCHPKPGLLAYFHHDPIFNSLDVNGHGCLSTRLGFPAGCDLYRYSLFCPQYLCLKIPAVELSQKGMCQVAGCDIPVKNSSVHVFDYNPLYRRRHSVVAFHIIMNTYAMKRIWFKTFLGVMAVIGLGFGTLSIPNQAEAYQEAPTATGVFVTVTYSDPINVRGGPSTISYPIVGQLAPGAVVPALGVSPAREWVQIAFPGTVSGTGWVYASFISVSGGELRIVEAPPTPTPQSIATIDPTLAAAFNVQPTQTRLPTFTPPPPLVPIDMNPMETDPRKAAPGIFIVILGLIGGLGLLVSFFLRK